MNNNNNNIYLTGAASLILVVSFFIDPISTSKNVSNILALEGSYFLVKHVLTDFANNHNEIIGFTAHCTSAVYGVKILKTGVDGVRKMGESISKTITNVKETFNAISNFTSTVKKFMPFPR